jgi:hypothetical protein
MHFYGAQPHRRSSIAFTIFTDNTDIINEARRRGVETPDHEEFGNQFRENRIALALEKHNVQYLKNQRRSPVETRFSNSYYVYSEPATPPEVPRERVASAKPDELPGKRKNAKAAKPDELPGKRKKITLCGRFPGTSVRQTRLPPSGESRKSQRRYKRKKNRFDLLYERTVEDTMKGKPIAWTTPSDVSSVDTETQPVSSSTTIPVAVPIDVDPIVTPVSKRRSARIEAQYAAQNPVESLTRSQSERRWRVFTKGLTRSEETQAWRDHIRQFYAEQEAKLKMAEETKSKK